MNSLTSLVLDLQAPNLAVVAAGKQNDLMSRKIAATLRDGDVAFIPPAGVAATIRYAKPDGTAGWYDVMEDGTTPAYSISGNVITFILCEQMLTVPGRVPVEINFYTGTEKLTTFSFILTVEKSVLADNTIISSDYFNVLTDQVAQAVAAAEEAAEIAANLPRPSDAAPQSLGTAAAGSSALYSRGDHVHPMPSASDVGALPDGTTPGDIGAVSAVDVQYKIYASVEDLGLTSGSATMAGIIAAMPNNSMLITSGNELASNEKPSGWYGQLKVIKPDPWRWDAILHGTYLSMGDWKMYMNADGTPTGVWIPQDLSFVKEGVTVFRKGRLRIIRLDSPSAWCATLAAEDTPSSAANVLSKIYNGSEYVDCNVSIGADSTVRVLSLWGSEIAGAQYSFLLNRYVTYFV